MEMNRILTGEIIEPEGNAEKVEANERKVREGFWRTVRKAASRVPFMEDVVAAYYCALDPETPRRTRAILLAALAYFVLPLDWIPDFVLGFGFTDDIAVLGAAIGAIRSSMRGRHYEAARSALSEQNK
jgi:uncharacterized membrane protein YkvA (DUF1232 family)